MSGLIVAIIGALIGLSGLSYLFGRSHGKPKDMTPLVEVKQKEAAARHEVAAKIAIVEAETAAAIADKPATAPGALLELSKLKAEREELERKMRESWSER